MISFLNINKTHKRIITISFFIGIFLFGLFIYRDYGLSWDEPISHINGRVTLAYLSEGNQFLWEYSERFYGVVVELPFALAERLLSLDTSQSLFFFRHIVTFILFIIGVFFFYLLCLERFKSRLLALLGSTFLVLSPRIFADAFYNSKDIPVMVFFIIAIYTFNQFFKNPSTKNIILHSLVTALIIATRIPGVFVLFLTVGMFLLNLITLPEFRVKWKKILISIGIYLAATMAFTILLWPFLWQQPTAHFIEAFKDMSKFSRQLGMEVLYLGDFITSSKLPWHYIPVWILVTTPFLYLTLFFFGLGTIVKRFSSNFIDAYRQYWPDVSVVGWFFGPIIAVILFKSVLYDGWRHLYFIYPALIYIALIGIETTIKYIKTCKYKFHKVLRIILISVTLLQISTVSLFMIKNHPYQNVYFNFLAGGMDRAQDNFDLDYWGLSFREGLEYIASNDNDQVIPIYFAGGSLDNVLILDPQIASRFKVINKVDILRAKYILSNYRWQNYRNLPFEREVYTVKVDGERIMSVFKVK